MIEFATALCRFAAGETSIIEAKAELLRHFPGCLSQHEALLLSDYVEEVALKVRSGETTLDEAAHDLADVQATELGYQRVARSLQ